MASSLGIDGLISGLDTTSLINQLMAVEAGPQTLLKSRQTSASSLVTALQSLNTKVASLAGAATAAATSTSWHATAATSSASGVTATATATAQPSSLTFRVDRLAQAQSTLYDLPTSYGTDLPTFTLTSADGSTTTTVTAATASTADILAAFNGPGTGVQASAVNVGTAAVPVYKLQLTGTATGAGAGFGLAVATDAGGGTAALTGTEIRGAQDAQLTLWPGSPAETSVTSPANTFAGLLTGVDVTVSAVPADPVTVTVARDVAAAAALASTVVTNLTTVLSEIADRTRATTGTSTGGRTVVTGGLFSGDSTIRMLQQNLQSVATAAVGGTSLASMGIALQKDGTVSFDAEAFAAALAADPGAVETAVSGMARQVADLATAASSSTVGSITAQITSQQGIVDDLADRITGWDDRLAARRESLQRTYTTLETSLSSLQSQSSWLAAQIAQLTSGSSG